MSQPFLPLFSKGLIHISDCLSYKEDAGQIYYYNGHALPVFSHHKDDQKSFKMIMSQFYINGHVTQAQIIRVFGIPKIAIARAVELFKKKGPSGFFADNRHQSKPRVLTDEVILQVQARLDDGATPREIALQLNLKQNTLDQAIRNGRLKKVVIQPSKAIVKFTTKSERTGTDAVAPMGIGATDVEGRLAASLGKFSFVEPKFDSVSIDLPNAGVLLALPALLANGLLTHTDKLFSLSSGYYGLYSIFIMIAFMLLCRVKTIEGLRYQHPGEWGKLLGLDRSPETKTLRQKVQLLSKNGSGKEWSTALCKDWMVENPSQASILYIDGHVRVYNGDKAKVAKHYVTREKLCLNATNDYWVNSMGGLPFFVVPKDIDPGLINVLENDIVPQLEKLVPNQPSEEELKNDKNLCRFTLVFDREGYSPEFFLKMKEARIGCITYNKFPKEDWPKEEFSPMKLETFYGEHVEMQIASRTILLGEKVQVEACEIRKLSEKKDHQTSIISTATNLKIESQIIGILSRWSQENFFKYMRQHFNLDKLLDYQVSELPENTVVVNPKRRLLESTIKKKSATIKKNSTEFGLTTIDGLIEGEKIEEYEKKKTSLLELITLGKKELQELKGQRKTTPKHIKLSEIPENERFQHVGSQSKDFMDTMKMIAYRAETAMVTIIREFISREDDARALARSIYQAHGDLVPDLENKVLKVRLHRGANASSDKVVQHLMNVLNEAAYDYPGTNLKLFFELA